MELPTQAELLAEAAQALAVDGRVVLCLIVRTEGSTPGKPGWRLLARRGGKVSGNLGGGAFEALVAAEAAARLADPHARSEVKRYYFTENAVRGEATGMVCGGLAEVFLEVVDAPPVLVLCGGGPVGQAVARAGRLAGFETSVVDDREEFRRLERFPPGTGIVAVGRDYGGDWLAAAAGRELFVAILTRCWETDVAALAGVLRQAPPRLRYLGLMGSRRKIDRVRGELARAGLDLAAVDLAAPIGLPLGGDSPGEIAIGIVAEMLERRYRPPVPATPQATGEAVAAGRR